MVKAGLKQTASPKVLALLKLYNAGFTLALPFLKRNQRLKTGWVQRTGKNLPAAADIWLQAASGGEAYLALELMRGLNQPGLNVLVTANTLQGHEILTKGLAALKVNAAVRYCPFDKPALMQKYMAAVKPKLVVLLETELWPGMLNAAKNANVPVLLVNGRISPKSLKGYLKLKSLFRALAPGEIMAISADDAARFKTLFSKTAVSVMPNIKFDRVATAPVADKPSALADYLPTGAPFVVLGSVRMEEEAAVLEIIKELRRVNPQCVIGFYPRHMERVPYWREILAREGLAYVLRSRLNAPLTPGTVLLGDTFGELGQAYALAAAVFVGGSLAPLGGQNFLEPLACGVVPIIGPSWKNFAWAGTELQQAGLLAVEPDAINVAKALSAALARPNNKQAVKTKFDDYLRQNLGGTAQAVARIKAYLAF